MAAPRYGGVQSLFYMKERIEPEPGTSGKVQSEQDPEPCGDRKEGRSKSQGDQDD